MCDCCNPKMYDHEVYYNSTDDAWYFDIETGEWSDYEDDFIHVQRQIKYCPYCGRHLYCKDEKNEIHTECYDDEEDELLLKQAFGEMNKAIDAFNSSFVLRCDMFIPDPSNCHLSYTNYNTWTGDEMKMCRQTLNHCPVADRNEKCPFIPLESEGRYENPC